MWGSLVSGEPIIFRDSCLAEGRQRFEQLGDLLGLCALEASGDPLRVHGTGLFSQGSAVRR